MSLFTDGLIHRLLPFHPETTLSAIRHFHMEQYPTAAGMAGAGALIASLLLYAIGIWLRRLPEKISNQEQQQRIEKLRVVAKEWLPWLLVLSPTPIGGILIMAAGFFAIRLRIAAMAIAAGEIFWRFSPLF